VGGNAPGFNEIVGMPGVKLHAHADSQANHTVMSIIDRDVLAVRKYSQVLKKLFGQNGVTHFFAVGIVDEVLKRLHLVRVFWATVKNVNLRSRRIRRFIAHMMALDALLSFRSCQQD
jgi:hypothetical protein